MPADLEFTGERFVPGATGMTAYEHGHRYAFALRYARGRRVLDAACGEGYGTALLAGVAASAIGVDIDAKTIEHARARYAGISHARFESASVTALPLPDASVDLVVSFETIEHVDAEDQTRLLAEFARVLVPDGVLVLSSPNRRRYSEERGYHNPFHVRELDRAELARLLDARFPCQRWHDQVPVLASALWSETLGPQFEAWCADGPNVVPAAPPEGVYYVVVCARRPEALPPPGPSLSLFADRDETEWHRAEAAHAEVIRLDRLLGERDRALDAQGAHVKHLEELVAYRERLVEARDAELEGMRTRQAQEQDRARECLASVTAEAATLRAALADAEREAAERSAENARLERALAAQERIIAYRQSVRWWVQLPWVRARALWQRLPGP